MDDTDPAKGTCTLAGGQKSGFRPLCWYKPGADGVSPAAPVVLQSHPKTPALVSSLQNPELWQGL